MEKNTGRHQSLVRRLVGQFEKSYSQERPFNPPLKELKL